MTTAAQDLPLLQAVARIAARIAEREAMVALNAESGSEVIDPSSEPLSAAVTLRPTDIISHPDGAHKGASLASEVTSDGISDRAA